MRDRLYNESQPVGEVDRLRFAAFDPNLITPTLASAPTALSGVGGATMIGSGPGVQPHHGVIGMVLLAVLILFLLDKAGFRFAVTVGRR